MNMAKREMKLGYMIVSIAVYILLLLAVRSLWLHWVALPGSPAMSRGVLDASGVVLEESRPLSLDGEWEFYPEQWVGASNLSQAEGGLLMQVPGNWNAAFQHADRPAYGYGTYHARIKLNPQQPDEPVALWFQSINTASEVEINGSVLARSGKLSESREGHTGKARAAVVVYMPPQGQEELHVFVRASNFDSPLSGGIVRTVKFGTQTEITRIFMYNNAFQLITISFLLMSAFFALIVYLMNNRKPEMFIFFMAMGTSAFTIGTNHSKLLIGMHELSFAWEMKLRAFSIIGFALFLLLMARNYIGDRHRGPVFWTFMALMAGYTLFIAVGPEETVLCSLQWHQYMFVYYISGVLSAGCFIRMVKNRTVGAIFLLFALVTILQNILRGVFYYNGDAQYMYYPVDLILGMTWFSAYWFKQYLHNSNENALLNAQLAEANQLKDRFLANTSHELRTPLHGIINIAQSVVKRQGHALDAESLRDMELLIRVSSRMSHMVNDLLDVIRLQDKQIRLNRKTVRVQSLTAGVVDMLRFLTEGRKVELCLRVPEELPPVYGDEERLVQVLVNLAHNAIKYTEEGIIELSAEEVGGQVRISIRDTGPGMDEAERQRVFQRYEQGILEKGGLGLGLNICKELVELHGSELTVRSEPGKGSEFSFMLPVADPAEPLSVPLAKNAERTPADAAAAASLVLHREESRHMRLLKTKPASIRVLAVDDDLLNLKVLTQMLTAEHYDVDTAASGQEALDKLQNGRWDLVVSDVMMPEMSGYEMTRRIRQQFTLYELPVILLTARGEPADVYAGFHAGANDYVTKPVDGTELLYRVSSLLSLKEAVSARLRMEAAYLQAQIHPHFLFNTLNSIVALSEVDTEKMKELVDAFSLYLRISFNFLTAGELVPLSRELQLVENYLYIERQRFGERIQVIWDIPETVEVEIPPLTLQPLVENAVRHGIMSRSGGGQLRIGIERREEAVYFSVSDNGKGMTAEQLAGLLGAADRENRGIGLFNTHSRLMRLYRQGLHVQSAPGEGTRVSFSIPLQA